MSGKEQVTVSVRTVTLIFVIGVYVGLLAGFVLGVVFV